MECFLVLERNLEIAVRPAIVGHGEILRITSSARASVVLEDS